MTKIKFNFGSPSPGQLAASKVWLNFTPTLRVNVKPETVQLPNASSRRVNGVAVIDFVPNTLEWCWKVDVVPDVGERYTEYVIVPNSTSELTYIDLTRVDPFTFTPDATPEAAWWAMAGNTVTSVDVDSNGYLWATHHNGIRARIGKVVGERGIEGPRGPRGYTGPRIVSARVQGGILSMTDSEGQEVYADGTLAGPKGDKGDKGDTGPVNALTIGTVTAGPAAAIITGTAPNQALSLTLPPGAKGDKGDKGDKGNAGAVTVTRTVYTDASGPKITSYDAALWTITLQRTSVLDFGAYQSVDWYIEFTYVGASAITVPANGDIANQVVAVMNVALTPSSDTIASGGVTGTVTAGKMSSGRNASIGAVAPGTVISNGTKFTLGGHYHT